MDKAGGDVESGPGHTKIPYWKVISDQGFVTPEVINHPYDGSGTEADPYVVVWIPNDPRNPMLWKGGYKWGITFLVGVATLAIAFASTAYTGGVQEIIGQFGASQEIVTLGVSMFVLGFATGPLLWAPLSEMYGRQIIFVITYGVFVLFNCGAVASQNMATLIVMRAFSGIFGSALLTNGGGVLSDVFDAGDRGLALCIFAVAPFCGPILGPIAGGFLGVAAGWRWVMGMIAIFTGVMWVVSCLLIPETYPVVLLRRRAERLSKITGKVYKTKTDIQQGRKSLVEAYKVALSRPWIMLFFEPIVLLLSVYHAIIYGTLYLLFAAFPIVYQQQRGWSQGIGGLPFIGVGVGMLFGLVYCIYDNKRYRRIAAASPGGMAPPESRLPPCLGGAILLPIGLFWFAWTNSPNVHWLASVAAGVPFGAGMVIVFITIFNYLIDSYLIFAASCLAANTVIRSTFGAVFPLFTSYMYDDLGIHWASTIPAFLALVCVPFPFLFYRYGAQIRRRCKFAAEAERFVQTLKGQQQEKKAPVKSEEQSFEEPEGERAEREVERNLEKDGSEKSSLTGTGTAEGLLGESHREKEKEMRS